MSSPHIISIPQEEALEILSQMISEINAVSPRLEYILRLGQHVCQILNWQEQFSWFYSELNGYSLNVPRPSYRKLNGKLIWLTDAPLGDAVKWDSEALVYGKSAEDSLEDETILDVYSNIEWVMKAAQSGYSEYSGETKISHLRSGKVIHLRRVRQFNRESFVSCLHAVKGIAFDFASRSYALLKYGNALQSIWENRRSKIEELLQPLGFTNHLVEINNGLNTSNPESWRSAVFECRSLLSDLANYLWRDPRPIYEYLPGKGDDGKLSVSKKEFSNRISAYIHQKGLTKSTGKFIRDECERLSISIRSLIAVQSKAHGQIGKDQADSIALATYLLVGEILLRTDMRPIERYVEPHPTMKYINVDEDQQVP